MTLVQNMRRRTTPSVRQAPFTGASNRAFISTRTAADLLAAVAA